MSTEGRNMSYYNEHAKQYSDSTLGLDFSENQERFLKYLNEGDSILDFGCGSGRDTKYFLKKGYLVNALDGSAEMCKLAEENTGIKVINKLFSEFDGVYEKYNGIWACASLLHLSKGDMIRVFMCLREALVSNGVIYASFKYGEYEGFRDDRYYTDFCLGSFQRFMRGVQGLEIEDYWLSADVRKSRKDEMWFNVILRKV